jgi:hypothetical protein
VPVPRARCRIGAISSSITPPEFVAASHGASLPPQERSARRLHESVSSRA